MKHWSSALIALALSGAAIAQPPAAPSPPPSPPGQPSAFQTMQWLYGSGEGAAASIQAYNVFRDYVLAAARSRPQYSVVLAPGTSLAQPTFIPCDNRPLAVVLDVDETALQNLGYEYDRDVRGYGYGQYSWERWEQSGAAYVAPMPGAVDALTRIRGAQVTVIFNSNRLAANAAGSEAALTNAGLGPAIHDPAPERRTLWLRGDAPGGSGKDKRREAISAHFCVIAMAGDQLGDFSDLFNPDPSRPDIVARRRDASSAAVRERWGNGWFILSNPVYGTGIGGTRNEVFPDPRTRWLDPRGAVVE